MGIRIPVVQWYSKINYKRIKGVGGWRVHFKRFLKVVQWRYSGGTVRYSSGTVAILPHMAILVQNSR